MNHSGAMQSSGHLASPAIEDSMKNEVLPASGHVLAKDDPDNPQNLPLVTKIYVSAAATALAFVVFVNLSISLSPFANLYFSAFGATAYTAGLKGVISRFDVSMQTSILGMSIYFWVFPSTSSSQA